MNSLLPDGTLGRSASAQAIRDDAGLPYPPHIPNGDWWDCYQLVERALLRYRRAVGTLPDGSPHRARLDALWPDALAQLGVVTSLCVAGVSERTRKRNPRRLTQRRRQQQRRHVLAGQLRAIVPEVERFGDAAARIAFGAAIDTAAGEFGAEVRRAEDALTALTAGLDELMILNRKALG